VSAITAQTATVAGSATNPSVQGGQAYFLYGPDGNPTGFQTASQPVPAGASGAPISAALTGLQPSTLYHYRLVVKNGDATSTGADATFVSSAAPAGASLAASSAASIPPASIPPVITNLRATSRCVRAPVVASSPTAGSRGLSFSFTLNEQASVRYDIKRHARSRAKRRCATPTGIAHEVFTDIAALTGAGQQGDNTTSLGTTAAVHRRLPRGRSVASRRGRVAAGHHRVSLARIAQDRALAPGTYVLFVQATNAAGQRSNIAHVKFFVLKR